MGKWMSGDIQIRVHSTSMRQAGGITGFVGFPGFVERISGNLQECTQTAIWGQSKFWR
jgi:hypothetical protein